MPTRELQRTDLTARNDALLAQRFSMLRACAPSANAAASTHRQLPGPVIDVQEPCTHNQEQSPQERAASGDSLPTGAATSASAWSAPAPGATVPLRSVIGDVLRQRRLSRQQTLREVATIGAVSLGYLSEVERGIKEASSEVLRGLCQALDIPMHQLLRDAADKLDAA